MSDNENYWGKISFAIMQYVNLHYINWNENTNR